MLYDLHNGQTSVVLRFKLRNSSVSTGAGLTGLTSASSGLIISTIADNEAAATAYTVAGSTIETIATLGTYAAPTATKCRFKEVDATNHPGIYEFQFADARFGVASAKSLTISVSGATNLAQCDVIVPLRVVDPYSATFALSGATVSGYAAGQDPATLVLGATQASFESAGTIGLSIAISAGLGPVTAQNAFQFFMGTTANPYAPATGLTVAAQRSTDGGAFTNCDNAVAEVGGGFYKIDLTINDMSCTSSILFSFTATGSIGWFQEVLGSG